MESRWESARNLLHDRPHLLPPWPKHRGPAGALVADQVEVGVPLVASSVLDDGQGAQGTPDRNPVGWVAGQPLAEVVKLVRHTPGGQRVERGH